MGGIQSFRKNGRGIMLLDNGDCFVTNYANNSMFGHNIMIHNDSITSILIDRYSNKDICFRNKQYMLQIMINKNR